MKKNVKILIFLLVISAALITFLILKIKPFKQVVPREEERVEKVDMEKVRKDYKVEIKKIFNDYLAIVDNDDLSIEQLEVLRNKLIGPTVPPELRDLHIDLLYAIIKRQDFLATGNSEDRADSEERVKRIKEGYDWIN